MLKRPVLTTNGAAKQPPQQLEKPPEGKPATPFGRLGILDELAPQGSKGEERKLSAKQHGKIKLISAIFQKSLCEDSSLTVFAKYPHQYYSSLDFIGKTPISSKDVELFTAAALHTFQEHEGFEEMAGYFLSALINKCTGSKVSLSLGNIREPISHLGLYSKKDITIYGDVGDYSGSDLKGGTMTIHGNAGHALGIRLAAGATIKVLGKTDDDAGYGMTGGRLEIFKSAGRQAGSHMKGGTLFVHGQIKSLGHSIEGGGIFCRGRQVVKGGKRTDEAIKQGL